MKKVIRLKRTGSRVVSGENITSSAGCQIVSKTQYDTLSHNGSELKKRDCYHVFSLHTYNRYLNHLLNVINPVVLFGEVPARDISEGWQDISLTE